MLNNRAVRMYACKKGYIESGLSIWKNGLGEEYSQVHLINWGMWKCAKLSPPPLTATAQQGTYHTLITYLTYLTEPNQM